MYECQILKTSSLPVGLREEKKEKIMLALFMHSLFIKEYSFSNEEESF